MRQLVDWRIGITIAASIAVIAFGFHIGRADDNRPSLSGPIVAIDIPGAAALAPVGAFLPGGPIHDKPEFADYTQPGQVLDPARILVGSTSSFGTPVANPEQLEGAFLSLDPRGPEILVIPPNFATAGGQASALWGRVQMYSAQSPPFRNGVNNPSAVTARFTGVSNPLGLSINNAFGRLWPANAPTGREGVGTSTILDPTGIPLAGAPNAQAGGVFAGGLTARLPFQAIPGALNSGAVGTAFLGHSPDGSTRAVFCVVLADGSLVQEHTGKAVDGLAPAGTVSPLLDRREQDNNDVGVSPRLGVLLNYSPTRILFISEPFENSITAIDLTDDGVVFRPGAVRRFRTEVLDHPVDLAPVSIETENPNWASNTTLDVGSDFYVANRGNNTIARMRQDGTVVAVREVRLAGGQPLGNARLNGIASSPDGTRIWVTVNGHLPGHGSTAGAVVELPSFP